MTDNRARHEYIAAGGHVLQAALFARAIAMVETLTTAKPVEAAQWAQAAATLLAALPARTIHPDHLAPPAADDT